jgi:two-component system CheB/CheR fusion protein
MSVPAPAGVVVNDRLDIIQFLGDTSAFLAPAPGRPSHSLLKMAREGLVVGLQHAIRKAQRTGLPVIERGIRLMPDGATRPVTIKVTPLKFQAPETRDLIILFDEAPSIVVERRGRGRLAHEESQIGRLRQELESTAQYLQSLVSEQNTTAEQLASATEQVRAAQKELQAAYDELKTAKDELQAATEEMTVHQEKTQHVTREPGAG